MGKTEVAKAMAKAAGIDSKRIPKEYVAVEAGSVKVTVLIQNPLQKSGIIEEDTRSAAVIVASITKQVLDGEYSAIPISAIIDQFGEKSDAPPLSSCSFTDEDSCASCLSQDGCGWCDYGKKWCALGTSFGPAFMTPKSFYDSKKAKARKKEKRKKIFKKLKLSSRTNAVSPKLDSFTHRQEELLQISKSKTKKKGRKKKKKHKTDVNSPNAFHYGGHRHEYDEAGDHESYVAMEISYSQRPTHHICRESVQKKWAR